MIVNVRGTRGEKLKGQGKPAGGTREISLASAAHELGSLQASRCGPHLALSPTQHLCVIIVGPTLGTKTSFCLWRGHTGPTRAALAWEQNWQCLLHCNGRPFLTGPDLGPPGPTADTRARSAWPSLMKVSLHVLVVHQPVMRCA